MRIIIVAGISGAGTSTALKAFADLDFYTIDNLPLPLFKKFMLLAEKSPERYGRSAVLPNIRHGEDFPRLKRYIGELAQSGIELVFLDASTEAILRRYSETRRPHPGFEPDTHATLSDAVQHERNNSISFKEVANLVVDTSDMTVHDLRRTLQTYAGDELKPGKSFRVNFVSFGFKYGAPRDCDLVVDVRFLPNPHFVEELRPQTGLDSPVVNYVLEKEEAGTFLTHYENLLEFLLPSYRFEGKSYLNIGIGCTGGKHRSVTIASKLAAMIGTGEYHVSITHRDLER